MANPVRLFQQARTILCLCPCCGKIVRLSDLQLQYKGVTPRTWLDKYELRVRKFEQKEERFGEEEGSIREIAREQGRRRAKRAVGRVVKSVLPGCRYDPKDIKAIWHPVDYMVFCGLASGTSELKKIAFLSKQTNLSRLQKIRQTIQSTIEQEAYDWQVIRITNSGDIQVEK